MRSPADNDGRAALGDVAQRTATLLRSAPAGAQRVRGSDWTVGEVGAHLAVALMAFTDAAKGDLGAVAEVIPDTEVFRDRLTAVTAATLELELERNPVVLADRIVALTDRFLVATTDLPPDAAIPTPWYGPVMELTVPAATSLLLGEQLIHGRDVALTLRRAWPLTAADALGVVPALMTMMPLAFRSDGPVGRNATFEVRLKGGPTFYVQVAGGRACVSSETASAVDCTLRADPAAFLLVAYGRIRQWRPILTGKLLPGGPKPWLALGFKGMFTNP